jgi:hypothetical protein
LGSKAGWHDDGGEKLHDFGSVQKQWAKYNRCFVNLSSNIKLRHARNKVSGGVK